MTDSATAPRRARRKAAGLSFTPVPLARKRHDGWSPDRQQRFLAALHAMGVVATAAKSVGMSGRSAYRLRNRPEAASFAAAWDKLLAESRDRALDHAMSVAMNTRLQQRTYRGQFIGLVTASDDRMVLAALRASGVAQRYRHGASSLADLHDFPSGKGHQ